MVIKFDRATIYVSHPVRGTTGDMVENCRRAMVAGKRIKKIFPECDFYIPANSDLILQVLYAHGALSVDQIIDADLDILDLCHGWFYLNFEDSRGSEQEWEEACLIGLTVGKEDWIRDSLEKASYGVIRNRLSGCVERAVEKWRRGQ